MRPFFPLYTSLFLLGSLVELGRLHAPYAMPSTIQNPPSYLPSHRLPLTPSLPISSVDTFFDYHPSIDFTRPIDIPSPSPYISPLSSQVIPPQPSISSSSSFNQDDLIFSMEDLDISPPNPLSPLSAGQHQDTLKVPPLLRWDAGQKAQNPAPSVLSAADVSRNE